MSSSREARQTAVRPHPYLSGNFAPIQRTLPLTPCTYSGVIPTELAGGQYVRNGGNPLSNEDLGRDAHWFDGDGMLSGVLFRPAGSGVLPEFVNQYLLTDIYLNARDNPHLQRPVLPSITTLVNPVAGLTMIIAAILRAIVLVIMSHLSRSRHPIKKMSVANTAVLFHDGRALATCESGPPLRFSLPTLETIGWFNGRKAENEPIHDSRYGFGGDSAIAFMKEWTTGHPRVDPVTNELISFHSTFIKPYIYYSIVPATKSLSEKAPLMQPLAEFNLPVPGVAAPKMMHDFGVAARHTVIMDLPLSLDPQNMTRGVPVVSYDPVGKSRFGVFPRYEPEKVMWFETNPCVIFHAANCWETSRSTDTKPVGSEDTVDLLVCRLTSASLIYSAGAIAPPVTQQRVPPELLEEEQCRLYYYSFALNSPRDQPHILHQWALSSVTFEFPTLSPAHAMTQARYVYGCSSESASYSAALGRAAKIDYLCKINVEALIARGKANPPQQIKGCVDTRTVKEILQSTDSEDPIKLFALPPNHYAQEPRFVSRRCPASEDDGWLLTYVFDESQLDASGECRADARSELWIIDAQNMSEIVAKIQLPQRVPYGLHGTWFSEDEIADQHGFSDVRHVREDVPGKEGVRGIRSMVRNHLEQLLA